MKLQTSQDYDVDNRYQETDGPNGSKVSDNNSGKRFLNQYIEKSKDANEQNITPERREDNRFVITGPGTVPTFLKTPSVRLCSTDNFPYVGKDFFKPVHLIKSKVCSR